MVLLMLVIFAYWRVSIFLVDSEFETQYDKEFTSPNEVNTILV